MGIFSRFSKDKRTRVLFVDIGSTSVALGAVVFSKEGHPHIEKIISSKIQVLSDLSFEKFEKEMQKSLNISISQMLKEHPFPIDRIEVHLASPWYASQVRNAKLSRPTPFSVTKKVLDDMMTREAKLFSEEELGGDKEGALKVLESMVMKVKLNGYEVKDPIGVSAKDLEFSIFVSVAPTEVISGIEKIIERHYRKPIRFSTFLASSYLVVRDYFHQPGQYLLVDIGGEVSDISLVRDGSLVQSVSFPRGRNFMLRKLSVGLGRSIDEAVSICTLYIEGKVDQGLKESCDTILSKTKDEWLSAFQSALFSISSELSIPDTILLTCHADVAPWFVETIQREEFHQYTLTEKEFKVTLLSADLFHETLSFEPHVKRNPFIMIEALRYAHHTHKIEL